MAIMPASAMARAGSPPRKRQHHREDEGRERRVGAQHEDAAGSEQGIGQQGHDRRVEPVDAGHARRDRIGDAHRHQHRGQTTPATMSWRSQERWYSRKVTTPGNQRIQPRPASFCSKRSTPPVAGSGEGAGLDIRRYRSAFALVEGRYAHRAGRSYASMPCPARPFRARRSHVHGLRCPKTLISGFGEVLSDPGCDLWRTHYQSRQRRA